jgi:hypothetical protein
MGASVPEFPGFTKQILGHAAHYPARNGKSSPAMISEDKSVRNFDRHIRHPPIAKQDHVRPGLTWLTSNKANPLKSLASLSRNREPGATAASLGSPDFRFAVITD